MAKVPILAYLHRNKSAADEIWNSGELQVRGSYRIVELVL